MPRFGLLLTTLAAAMLQAQSSSNQSAATNASQTQPASPAEATPDRVLEVLKVERKEIPLEASPTPRSLDQPQSDGAAVPSSGIPIGSEAERLLRSISLCDPVPCLLGEGPKVVWIDGRVKIRFPDSYHKPATETKDVAKKEPASPETNGEKGVTPK